MTNKSDRKTWSNANGSGELFSVDLLDADVGARADCSPRLIVFADDVATLLLQGGQIKATVFKDAVPKFWNLLQENKVSALIACCMLLHRSLLRLQVYIISKGSLKIAKKQCVLRCSLFSLTDCLLPAGSRGCRTSTKSTSTRTRKSPRSTTTSRLARKSALPRLCFDDRAVPCSRLVRYNFVSIEQINNMDKDAYCDVLGVVISCVVAAARLACESDEWPFV